MLCSARCRSASPVPHAIALFLHPVFFLIWNSIDRPDVTAGHGVGAADGRAVLIPETGQESGPVELGSGVCDVRGGLNGPEPVGPALLTLLKGLFQMGF